MKLILSQQKKMKKQNQINKRKFENEDDNKEYEGSYKEDKKQEIIDLKASNNKEKFNSILFKKMLNNINNNNYNHYYNINNNSNININNNNVFNNINPINYNNEYLFNFISSNNSMEKIFLILKVQEK